MHSYLVYIRSENAVCLLLPPEFNERSSKSRSLLQIRSTLKGEIGIYFVAGSLFEEEEEGRPSAMEARGRTKLEENREQGEGEVMQSWIVSAKRNQRQSSYVRGSSVGTADIDN